MRQILLLTCIALMACMPKVPLQRLETRAQARTAIVFEASNGVERTAVPQSLIDALKSELDGRNLELAQVDAASLSSQKLTDGRFAALKTTSAEAAVTVLIEVRAHFFSQLDGRYRWEVSTALTAERKDGQRASETFTVPVILMFEHERAAEAVASAAPDIARQLGRLVDAVLVEGTKPGASLVKPNAIYFAMVDRFENGDRGNDGSVNVADPQAFHGGDIAGLLKRKSWVQSLNADAVWVTPVTTMRTDTWHGYGAFHGYWPYDVNSIEPRFGSLELLRRLSTELHQSSGQLILDVVLNHVGPDAPLLKQHPEWFHHNGGIVDWAQQSQLEEFDVQGLSDLAQEKPEVFNYLLNASLTLLKDSDADGLRLDAVKHVSNRFWSKFNSEINRLAGRPRMLIGEYLDGDAEKVARAWREGQFTAMFDFPLAFAMIDVFCKAAPASKLAVTLSDDRLYPNAQWLVTLLDNHDLPRLASQCGEDQQRILNALTFLTSIRGVPSITWGTETAMTGAKEPDNRKSMQFVEGPLKEQVSRLLKQRKESPALKEGASVLLAADSSHIAIGRVSGRELAVICVNQSAEPWALSVSQPWSTVLKRCEPGVTVTRGQTSSALSVGAQTRVVHFTSKTPGARLAGSAPELGHWNVGRALPLPATVELPANSAIEFKMLTLDSAGQPQWEQGENHFLFIDSGTTRIELSL